MKKISNKKINGVISEQKPENTVIKYNVNGEVVEIEVRTHISLSEIMAIIDFVIDNMFQSGYLPELEDVLIFKAVIEVMTNIPVPTTIGEDESVEIVDIDKCYELMTCTDILDKLWEINEKYLLLITRSVSERSMFRKTLMLNAFNDTSEVLKDKLEGLNELTSGLRLVVDKLYQTLDVVENKIENANLKELASSLLHTTK